MGGNHRKGRAISDPDRMYQAFPHQIFPKFQVSITYQKDHWWVDRRYRPSKKLVTAWERIRSNRFLRRYRMPAYTIPARIPTSQRWCSKPKRREMRMNENHEKCPSGTDLKSDLMANLRANDLQNNSSIRGMIRVAPISLNAIEKYTP